MKLKPGVTVRHQGQTYKGELPDELSHLVTGEKPNAESPKKNAKKDK